jgi:acyl carrier protein
MVLEEFTRKFADCFYQVDPQSIKPDTEFKRLEEWGSMMALIVIAMVDSELGKTISADDLKNSRTVADLFEAIKKK